MTNEEKTKFVAAKLKRQGYSDDDIAEILRYMPWNKNDNQNKRA